jgi:hypothetical protein
MTRRAREPTDPEPLPPGGARAMTADELRARRDQLARDYATAQWDLGGLVYEMAIRDHYRLDVLTHHAARLQQLDAQLGAIERLTRLEDGGAAGACPSCDALYARGAAYCSNCGHQLLPSAST